MRAQSWLVMVSAAAVTGVLFLGRPDISLGAGGGVGTLPSVQEFSFSYASTAAGFVGNREGGGVVAELVSQGVTNGGIGDAFCRVGVTFNDERGAVLQYQEVTLGPGEIARVDLPSGAPEEFLSFRVSFRALDRDRAGRIRPCFAIPSVRVWDRVVGKTDHYVPILMN
jgi:hypothetical protein